MKKNRILNINKNVLINKNFSKFSLFIIKLVNIFQGLNQKFKRLIFILIDFFLILISIFLINFIFIDQIKNINYVFPLWNYPAALFATFLIYSISVQNISLSKYISSSEIFDIITKNFCLNIVIFLSGYLLNFKVLSFKFYFLLFIISSFFNIVYRFSLKEIFNKFQYLDSKKICKVVIYGAGAAGAQLASALILARKQKIIAFIDDSPNLWGRKLMGINIYPQEKIKSLQGKFDQILLAIPSLSKEESRKLLMKIYNYEIPVLKVPSIDSLTSGIAKIDSLRPIQIEDLLGRGQVKPNNEYLETSVKNLSICITGAGGSIGREICRQILKLDPQKIVLLDISEPSLYYLQQEIKENKEINKRISVFTKLGNAQDFKFIKELFIEFKIDIVFHAAAYKHVPLIEDNALVGIKNNVISTLSVCEAAELTGVKQVTLISTDKAVRPTNVMGASKRVAELICQAFAKKVKEKNKYNKNVKDGFVKYSIVRFGNVLNSSGSVVPLFKKQIAQGGPVTVTDKNVIRYFMTIPEAAQLVIQANYFSSGGDVFLLDMGEPVKIYDLAKQMIRLSGLTVKDKKNPRGQIDIVTTGLRPGEKMYEELLINGKAKKTIHPLIYKADEKFSNEIEIFDKFLLLKKSLEDQDLNLSIKIISKLVPEWDREFN